MQNCAFLSQVVFQKTNAFLEDQKAIWPLESRFPAPPLGCETSFHSLGRLIRLLFDSGSKLKSQPHFSTDVSSFVSTQSVLGPSNETRCNLSPNCETLRSLHGDDKYERAPESIPLENKTEQLHKFNLLKTHNKSALREEKYSVVPEPLREAASCMRRFSAGAVYNLQIGVP